MADRRFLYAVSIGGNDYELHVASDTDRVLGHVKDTDFTGGNQVLITAPTGVKGSVTVDQNQLLGQESANGIRGLSATQVRSILNVANGAESNAASNLGVLESLQIYGLWEDKQSSVLRFKSIGPYNTSNLKLYKISNTRILFDPLTVPKSFQIHGNARLNSGDVYAMFKTGSQSITLDKFSAVITHASLPNNPGLQFRMYRNSIRKVDAGVTLMLDFSGAAARLTDTDGTGNGTLAAGADEAKFPTASGQNVIPADTWLIFHVMGKTDDVAGDPNIDELHMTMFFSPT